MKEEMKGFGNFRILLFVPLFPLNTPPFSLFCIKKKKLIYTEEHSSNSCKPTKTYQTLKKMFKLSLLSNDII